ncbi:MAG: hypothetical protein RR902_05140 [Oscillospiraceae bacterium]
MTDIDFKTFSFSALVPDKKAAVVFEKIPLKREFKDTLTFYCDGKVVFRRFCFGEAAGEVCTMTNEKPCGNEGEIYWNYENAHYSRSGEAPKKLYATDENGALFFDKSPEMWKKVKELKTDKANGYSFFKMLFMKK